jgi:NADH:ubiquinone oxidoreductase subunit E
LNPSPELAQILERFPRGKRENLIPILQEAQEAFGYLSQETMQASAPGSASPVSKVFGVATFLQPVPVPAAGQGALPGLPRHGLPRERLGRRARDHAA